jgi:hypothetical protein
MSSVNSTTFPNNLVSTQPPYVVKLKSTPMVGSIYSQISSMPSCESSNSTPNAKASQVGYTPSNKGVDEKWQHLSLILKFLNEQMTSQLPLLFGSAIGLIIIAMLIGQASGGIKLKLDLEVSPAPNQSEKAPTVK